MAPGPIPITPHRPGSRHRIFSPTQLRNFSDCPERYYRQYIGHERMRAEFNRATLRGSAAHKVLARYFTARMDGEILVGDIRPLAERFLPSYLYRAAGVMQEWAGDVDIVLTLVKAGIARVPLNGMVIAVEKSFSSILSTKSPVAGAELVGKVDLLYRHPGGFLEQIEFKTGSALPDDYQEVICRMGVCGEYNKLGLPVLSTTVQLTSSAEYPVDGDRRKLRSVLGEIEHVIGEIWNATSWPAKENGRCVICNYRSTICSRFGDLSRPNRLALGDLDDF